MYVHQRAVLRMTPPQACVRENCRKTSGYNVGHLPHSEQPGLCRVAVDIHTQGQTGLSLPPKNATVSNFPGEVETMTCETSSKGKHVNKTTKNIYLHYYCSQVKVLGRGSPQTKNQMEVAFLASPVLQEEKM